MKENKTVWQAGVKRTRQRESVLAVLEHSDKPLSAAEICSKIEMDGDTVWMSTVYRVLELFVEKGVALKTTVLNNEMAVYELNRFQHKHYAVCMKCRKIIPMGNCPMENFTPMLAEEGFQIVGHNLEVFGYCRDCRSR
ncbi:Fur family transcriptional regulator [Oscillibacter sp.]|uniref:Fur family transcriptional regulator n=1 Tax=Oscillibacter sp. TaxID=1945593 RepID=UPI0025F01DEC|nr:transcriptional repressor [Oscillibacter sp.]